MGTYIECCGFLKLETREHRQFKSLPPIMADQTDYAQAYATYCQATQEAPPAATAQEDQYQYELGELLPGLIVNHRNSRSLYNAYRKGVLREVKGSFPRL